mmetsp:Transcript_43279/g.49003  ORF Transcript_43279/g.49003 Transcript_43279/m.49003 type:complete len:110 (-) Transcript_43279:26-355(-)
MQCNSISIGIQFNPIPMNEFDFQKIKRRMYVCMYSLLNTFDTLPQKKERRACATRGGFLCFFPCLEYLNVVRINIYYSILIEKKENCFIRLSLSLFLALFFSSLSLTSL